MRDKIFTGLAVILITIVAACKATVNPDFEQYILDHLNKNQSMNFSIVDIAVTSGPWRTDYEIGEVWKPVDDPGNPGQGIEITATLGGGSQRVYRFLSYSGEILAMKHEDGSVLKFRVDNFDTLTERHKKALKLTLLDGAGVDYVIPKLPATYGWAFENENHGVSVQASTKTPSLYYNVYAPGGLSGSIRLEEYYSAWGDVWITNRKYADADDTIEGKIVPTPGYMIASDTLRYEYGDTPSRVSITVDASVIDYSDPDYPAGIISFSFDLDSAAANDIINSGRPVISFKAQFERKVFSITWENSLANGQIAWVTVNGNSPEHPLPAYMGDTITVCTKAEEGYQLQENGLSYTLLPGETAITVPANPLPLDADQLYALGRFVMPCRNIKLTAVFNSAAIAYLTFDSTKGGRLPDTTDYTIGKTFDPTGLILQAVLNDRYGTTVQLRHNDADDNTTYGTIAFTVSGTDASNRFTETGIQTVTYSVGGHHASFTVTVSAGNAVAMRTENGRNLLYTTLAAAITAAQAGETITVINDIALTSSPMDGANPPQESPLTTNKNLTLKAQGTRTIKAASNISSLINITGGTLTLGGAGGTLILDGGASWTGGSPPAGSTPSPAYGASNTTISTTATTIVTVASASPPPRIYLRDGAILRNGTTGVSLASETGFSMEGGEISDNADDGVSILTLSSTVDGGLITRNGKAGIWSKGNVIIDGTALITENKEAGVYIDHSSTSYGCDLRGGLITNNISYGVFVKQGEFIMSSNAIVAENNPVYLASTCISFKDGYPLNASIAAWIVPVGYDGNPQVVASTGPTEKFALAPVNGVYPADANGSPYFIETDGKIYTAGASRRRPGGGNWYYQTLARAITAAAGTISSPDTITLWADIGMNTTTINTIKDAFNSGKHIKLTVPPNKTKKLIRNGNDTGAFFSVNSGSSLTLEGNGTGELILDGNKNAFEAANELVRVDGIFTMNEGSALQNNKNSRTNIGAVNLYAGTFNMNGGTIKDNEVTPSLDSGCVYVYYATLNMSGGVIKDNKTFSDGAGVLLYVSNSVMNMSGGNITGNMAKSSTDSPLCKGVDLYSAFSTLNMSGSAVIDDVYLKGSFNLTGDLTGTGPVATIKPVSTPSTADYSVPNNPRIVGGPALTPANLAKIAVSTSTLSPPWSAGWQWVLAGSSDRSGESGYVAAPADYGKLWVGSTMAIQAEGGAGSIDFTLQWPRIANVLRGDDTFTVSGSSNATWTATFISNDDTTVTFTADGNPGNTVTFRVPSMTASFGRLLITCTDGIASYSVTLPDVSVIN